MSARSPVLLCGDGLLADAIDRALGGTSAGRVRRQDSRAAAVPGDIVVHAHDSWRRAEPAPATPDTARLVVRTELGRAVLGPVEVAGRPGCMRCVETRQSLADERPEDTMAVLERYPAELAGTPSRWLTPLAASLVGTLTADRIDSQDQGSIVLVVDLDTLAVSSHTFLPDPSCDVCGQLPVDSAELATVVTRPRRKPSVDSYRIARSPVTYENLAARYVDGHVGLIRTVRTGSDGNVAVASAPFGLRYQPGRTESGYGRSASFENSRTVALLEALERHGGVAPGGKRTTVHARYDEIRDVAVDPRHLGAYPAEPYGPHDAPFTPYDHEASRYWVWGFSFSRGEAVLVPQSNAYYRARFRYPGDPQFVRETSNGSALGSCLEEAIVHGLLEVLERDAFLMTWYARMPVPPVDLASSCDPRVPMLAGHIRNQTGLAVEVFDTTLEEGVPCVWAVAVNPADDGRAALVCAAGCHPNPEQAVLEALYELGSITSAFLHPTAEQAAKAERLLADPAQVVEMGDHALLHTHRKALPRLDFLLQPDRVPVPFDAAFAAGRRWAPGQDLGADLRELVGRCTANGLDVVAVDQTTPEHLAGGFHCVKVLVPGMLPMTFGHRHRRVAGFPRLFEVPFRLGYRDRPLTADTINPDPHPFP